LSTYFKSSLGTNGLGQKSLPMTKRAGESVLRVIVTCVNNCVSTNKKGPKQLSLGPYNVLVAGTGFEPVTFGL